MLNFNHPIEVLNSETMENYLSIIIRKPWILRTLEENKWLNVQNVEQTFQHLRRSGLWLGAQTSPESGCSWKLDFSTVPNVRNPSEKS
jgi:hypothetical protein